MIKTRVIRINPLGENALEVGEIAAALLGGAIAAYPTETFYALGAAAFSKKAVERIYRLKKRDASKPLSVISSDLDMVREISASLPPSFMALAGEFWPGPLTLVLPAAAGVPEFLLGPGRTIAVRIPPLPWLRGLVRGAGARGGGPPGRGGGGLPLRGGAGAVRGSGRRSSKATRRGPGRRRPSIRPFR